MSEPNINLPTRIGWAYVAGAWVVVAMYSAACFLLGCYWCGGCA